jgi:hypothetical protein
MKAVASVLCVCTVFGKPQQPDKTRRGRGKNHESAWDQAEQNKDANAFENLLAESLDYVVTTDPSARSSNFWQAGRGQTSPESRSTTRTRPCDCTATMWQRAPASTGTKACQTANRSRAVYERLAESKWPMGMHCQPIDFDYALMAEGSERQGTTMLCVWLAAAVTESVVLREYTFPEDLTRAYRGFPGLREPPTSLRRP